MRRARQKRGLKSTRTVRDFLNYAWCLTYFFQALCSLTKKKKKKRKIHKETKFSRLHNNTGQLHLHHFEIRSNLHHIICSTRTSKTSSMCQQQSQFFSVSWLPVHLSYFALPWNQHYRAQILRNSHWNKESFLKQKRQCNSHGLI